jgi:hypothetical protein
VAAIDIREKENKERFPAPSHYEYWYRKVRRQSIARKRLAGSTDLPGAGDVFTDPPKELVWGFGGACGTLVPGQTASIQG